MDASTYCMTSPGRAHLTSFVVQIYVLLVRQCPGHRSHQEGWRWLTWDLAAWDHSRSAAVA